MDFNKIIDNSWDWLSVYSIKFIFSLLIFLIGKWASKKTVKLIEVVFQKNNFDLTTGKFLKNIIYYTLMTGVCIAIANQLGINTTSFLTILGAAGLAIGLALKDSLSNFASGVMLILFPPFKAGDVISASGINGKVEEVNIFSTIIHTADNKRIFVPNSKISSDIVTNLSINPNRRIEIVVGIGYDDDLQKAKSILQTILDKDERILPEPAPAVLVTELANSSVNISVRPWVNREDYFNVYCHLNEIIKLKFDQEGINIPYPTQDINLIKK